MSTVIPNADAGMAGIETESFRTVPLFAGEFPIATTEEVVADAVVASADLPAYTVVGRDADGKIVPAVYDAATPANAIAPIGITVNTVKAGAGAKTVAVYRSGYFNRAALNWPESFDTDAVKARAFEASAPTIFTRNVASWGA